MTDATLLLSDEECKTHYMSVWGDTVEFKEFLIALAIGIAFGIVCSDGALVYLKTYHADLSKGGLMGTALMIGAIGSIIAGVIGAMLFKPKRIISEENLVLSTADIAQELNLNLQEEAELLKTAPDDIICEMKQLGIYQLFSGEKEQAI